MLSEISLKKRENINHISNTVITKKFSKGTTNKGDRIVLSS